MHTSGEWAKLTCLSICLSFKMSAQDDTHTLSSEKVMGKSLRLQLEQEGNEREKFKHSKRKNEIERTHTCVQIN